MALQLGVKMHGYSKEGGPSLVIGKSLFTAPPVWKLGDKDICTEKSLNILGVTFTSDNKFNNHVKNRISAAIASTLTSQTPWFLRHTV